MTALSDRVKTLLINIIFTILLLALFFIIASRSHSYFVKNSKSFNYNLKSDLENYRIKLALEPTAIDYKDAFANYDSKPAKVTHNIVMKGYLESVEAMEMSEDIEEEIAKNPLFKGLYIQIGVFTNKEIAQESINILNLKGIISEEYTTYIQTKNANEKDFYIVEIGVFDLKKEAEGFCNKLQKLQIACIIV